MMPKFGLSCASPRSHPRWARRFPPALKPSRPMRSGINECSAACSRSQAMALAASCTGLACGAASSRVGVRYFSSTPVTPMDASHSQTCEPSCTAERKTYPPPGATTTAVPFGFAGLKSVMVGEWMSEMTLFPPLVRRNSFVASEGGVMASGGPSGQSGISAGSAAWSAETAKSRKRQVFIKWSMHAIRAGRNKLGLQSDLSRQSAAQSKISNRCSSIVNWALRACSIDDCRSTIAEC